MSILILKKIITLQNEYNRMRKLIILDKISMGRLMVSPYSYPETYKVNCVYVIDLLIYIMNS